jgi:hypothetical protein
MPAHPARLLRGREIERPSMIEQQKGRELGVALIVEHGMDGEAVSNPVAFGLTVDT